MALYATHLKFAVELREKLGIDNVVDYYTGAIYPDSRYLTKIERNKTHDSCFLKPSFYEDSDFKKGWMTHVLYDQCQFKVIGKLFESFIEELGERVIPFNSHWQFRTAVKIVQDIVDSKSFKFCSFLKEMNVEIKPNKEDESTLSQYYSLIQGVYSSDINIDSYKSLWLGFGVTYDIYIEIKKFVDQILNTDNLMNNISLIHGETIKSSILVLNL